MINYFFPNELAICFFFKKKIQNVSKFLTGSYKSTLKDKRIYVENEWDAKCLYNCVAN
jgi:hypothetical protein